MKYLLVFSTVLITILSSVLLDYGAENFTTISVLGVVLFGMVLLVNCFKFVLWGWIHKSYDVSKSYPLTAMFFPLIMLVSFYQNETVISWPKMIGVLLIVSGIIMFSIVQKKAKL